MWRLLRRKRTRAEPSEQEKALRMDYGATFGSEAGRRVLAHLIEDVCHVWNPSYRAMYKITPEDCIFFEGEKNVGLTILKMLEIKDMDDLQEFADL